MNKNIIFIGPPASGKGTQADLLEARLGYRKISAGISLRHEVAGKTEIGKIIEPTMTAGNLIPAEIVNKIIEQEIGKSDTKFVIDGYPREQAQLSFLDGILLHEEDEIYAININLEDDEVIHRISGRLSCPVCGSSFHLDYKKPNKENFCDKCNATLIHRKDETQSAIAMRLENYHSLTKPLKDFFQKNNHYKYFSIDGSQPIEDVFSEIKSIID